MIAALGEVPAFQPRLLELVKKLLNDDGSIDPNKVAFHNLELEEAIGEARAYAESTHEAVKCLKEILRY